MPLPRPILHNVRDEDSSSWPPEIQGCLSESESESQKSPVSSPETGSPPFYSVLQTVDQSVVSSIQRLKHLTTATRARNLSIPGHLECLQTSLIASAAVSSLKEPVLLSDVAFILPRVSDDPANAARSGRAILMVGTAFRVKKPEELAPENAERRPPSAELASRKGERNAGPPLPAVLNGNNSPDREELMEAIKAPFDAHILPGRGRRTSCFIPAICVADKTNIKALITSAAYQRLALGVLLPAYGISLSSDDTGPVTVQFVVGWIADFEEVFEGCTDFASPLPPVHLTFVPCKKAGKASEHFNMQDPADGAQLCGLIKRACDQFSEAMERMRNFESTKDICWRSDHTYLDNPLQNPHVTLDQPRDYALSAWLKDSAGREGLDSEADVGSFHLPHAILPAIEGDSRETTEGSRFSPSFLPSRDERTSTAPRTRKSHYSASEFAALPPPKPRLILPRSDVWLWTHGALGVACCRLSKETKWQFEIFSYEPDDLNRMVDLYESNVKKPCWPPHWRELDDLPSSNGTHAHSRELLFEEYRARSINDKAQISAPGDLGPEISEDISSVLFQATELAACLAKQHARMNDISDTNHHLPWDLILYKLTSKQPGSSAFLHNGPTYILRSPSLADDHDSIGLSRAQLWSYLIFYQLTGTSDSDCTPSEMTRLEDRSLYVNELARPFPNFPRHKLGSPDSVQKGDILRGLAKADHTICAMVQPIQGSEVISAIIHSTFVDPPGIEGSEIGLPYCHVKYKRDSEDEDFAYEHLKEACISTVHLLSLLGIPDFPVFGLLSSGSKGTVILTWKSIEQTPSQPGSGCVFVMDHLVHTFDISKSFETLQFIFTLYRIFKFGEKLQELLHDRDLSSCSEIFGAGMGSS